VVTGQHGQEMRGWGVESQHGVDMSCCSETLHFVDIRQASPAHRLM
jgi:hypothetical protein